MRLVQAFHFKFGQGAKTGTGGHLPGAKVVGRIAEVRGLTPGTPAVSPATFVDLRTVEDYRDVAAEVRDISGGIPIGAKLSAQHIEADLDTALAIGVDYVILDGRGGGTGAAPKLTFRDNISVPTIPTLARARRHLDATTSPVTLVITGGLRTPADFVKALALGADAVAISNAALQAIGCLGMRACSTDNCPVGIATQKPGIPPAPRDRRCRPAPDALPPRGCRADGGADPGMRPRPRVRAVPRRPHHVVRPRAPPPRRRPLRRTAPMTELVWHKVLGPGELDEGRVTTMTIGRRTFAVAHADGRYGCLDNACPHQGGPLGEGSIENGWLRCPWHGYDYSPLTGQPPPGFSDAPGCYQTDASGRRLRGPAAGEALR